MLRRINHQEVTQTCLKNTRIPIYCTLILLCSMISAPDDYRVDKRNILNQWFVKMGWFWTTILVLPLLLLNVKEDDKKSVSSAIFRFILSTVLWFLSVNLFQMFDNATGFDISGHTFLLIFSNLVITSELRLSKSLERTTSNGSIGEVDVFQQSSKFIKLSLFVLTILWDFMLFQTALYYHTMIQKAIAAFWAIGSWYIMHVLFYEDKLRVVSGYRPAKSK